MTQKKKIKKYSVKIPPRMLTVAGVVLVLLLILLVAGGKKNAVDPLELQAGRNFLEQQEQKNPDIVRQARQALYVRRMEAQKDELLATVESGDLDPFTLFQNYAVLGDSRAVGFSLWGFLDSDRVLADAGNNIRTIPDKYEALKALQPGYVYLCFGINDCGIGFGRPARNTRQSMWKLLENCRRSCLTPRSLSVPHPLLRILPLNCPQTGTISRTGMWR